MCVHLIFLFQASVNIQQQLYWNNTGSDVRIVNEWPVKLIILRHIGYLTVSEKAIMIFELANGKTSLEQLKIIGRYQFSNLWAEILCQKVPIIVFLLKSLLYSKFSGRIILNGQKTIWRPISPRYSSLMRLMPPWKDHIIIIIIIIRKGRQCKAEREWYTPYQSEDPSPTIPTYRQKKWKGKRVEDYSRDRAA